MTKLNDRKIRWIIREVQCGSSMSRIARIQGISKARVSQLYRRFRETGQIPTLKRPGRPPVPIKQEEYTLVLEMHEKYHLGPVALERKIRRECDIHIPHNRIYRILLKEGRIMESPSKKKRRKYVRYEREHSMSMWQGDWKLVHLDNCKEKWMIAFMDDASRRIMCYALYDKATTENTIKTLEIGFKEYGCPQEILTDHGPQFTSNKKDIKGRFIHRFEEYLKEKGIRHILARVNHPQTNGKIERFFGTLEQKLHFFNYDVDRFIEWYNYDKPHMSLDFENAETPDEAFWRKLSQEQLFKLKGVVD